MKKSFLVCLSLCVAIVSFSYSQEEPDISPVDFNNIQVPETPNGASLGRYGDIPVNMATGIPNIQIPIFSFEVDGLHIPISLSYHASGVQVNELASSVGLNWTLNAGGGIFRTINSLPDEDGWITQFGPLSDEFYSNFSNIFQANYRREMVGTVPGAIGKSGSRDHNPDDYNYNFLDHSGKFIINFGNEAMKHEADGLEIDFDFDISTIKDQNGNKYYFGDEVEKTFRKYGTAFIIAGDTLGGGNTSGAEMEYGSPTGWMLSKIITKNGKVIYFKYLEHSISENNRSGNQFTLSSNISLGYECTLDPLDPTPTRTASFTNTYGFETQPYPNGYSTQLISKIESDTYTINFIYGEDERLPESKIRLEKIVVQNLYTNENKEFYFVYDIFSGVPRLQLKKVYEKKENLELPGYSFDYISGNLPDRYSFSQDLFGYYNGKSNPSSLVPYDEGASSQFSNAGFINFYTNNTSDRSHDFQFLQMGTLKEIWFPTGGSTAFFYEPNVESQYVGTPHAYTKYCGGLRVKRIEHTDGQDTVGVITYDYEGLMGRSYETDRHFTHTQEEAFTYGGGTTYHSNFVMHKSISRSGYFYENVTETRVGDGESIKRENNFIENYTYDRLSPLLKSEKLYNHTNIAKITEYEYEYVGKEKKISWNILGEKACGMEDGGTRVFTTYKFGDKMHFRGDTIKLPTKIAITEFFQGNPVTTIKEIEYDDETLLKLTETFDTRYTRDGDFSYTQSNPDGERIVSKFYYPTAPNYEGFPYDFPTGTLLKKEIFNETGGVSTKILGQAMEYDSFGNIKTVYSHNKGEQQNASPLSYVPPDYEKMTDFIYKDGFPVQVINKEGTPVSFIWNLKGNFIAAKIEGLTRDEINQSVIESIENASYTSLSTALGTLSSGISPEDAFVTTFIVNPLTGLEVVTDPKGEKTYYEYDAFGKLILIKDHQGNILEETQYNYRLNYEEP